MDLILPYECASNENCFVVVALLILNRGPKTASFLDITAFTERVLGDLVLIYTSLVFFLSSLRFSLF